MCNYIGALPNTERDEYPVPGNLHALILSRLDNLPQNLRMILHKAAVIGNEFFVEILREVESRLNDPSNTRTTLGCWKNIHSLCGFWGLISQLISLSNYYQRGSLPDPFASNRKLLHSLTAEAIEKSV
jgi:hypothetical protein